MSIEGYVVASINVVNVPLVTLSEPAIDVVEPAGNTRTSEGFLRPVSDRVTMSSGY